MQPKFPPTGFSRSSTTFNERDILALADFEKTVAAVLPLLEAVEVEPRRPPAVSPRARPVQVSSVNDDAPKMSKLITDCLGDDYLGSYEGLMDLFLEKKKLKNAHDLSNNTLLHEAIRRVKTEAAAALQLTTVLLEVGAETEIQNALGDTAISLVAASGNSLLVELIALPHPSKEGLIELLEKYNMHACIDWMEMPDCMITFEQEAPGFEERVESDPVNVLLKILTFYQEHVDAIDYVPRGTKITQLHKAVQGALEGRLISYFEVFILLRLKLDRDAPNCKQETPRDLVNKSNDDILKTLMAEPNPTDDLFYRMARKHPELKGWLAIKA